MNLFDLRQWSGFASAGGNPAAPALVEQVVIDSRRIASRASVFVALPGAHQDGHRFVSHAAALGASYAIVKKDWEPTAPLDNLTLLRVDHPLEALQQLAAANRKKQPAKVVGITGSQGKTMLKDLLLEILSRRYRVAASPESFNSQIGVALSLLSIGQDHDLALIEAGISHPGEMDALAAMIAPDHVIITNVGTQHAPTLGSIDAIAKEKSRLAAGLSQKGWLIAPRHPVLDLLTGSCAGKAVWWNDPSNGLPHATPRNQGPSLAYTVTFPDQTKLEGMLPHAAAYHLELVNIALKAAWLLDVPPSSIGDALQEYRFETTRTEVWECSQGTTLINSPYCADPQSVDLALRRLSDAPKGRRRLFLFGGMRGMQNFQDAALKRVGHAVATSHLDAVALYGPQNLAPLASELQRQQPSLPVRSFPSLPQALKVLADEAQPSDLVLIKGPRKHLLEEVVEAYGDDIAPNICTINLAAVEHNLATLKPFVPGARMMVMVKALAYGTEDIRMANFLKNCGIDILGVSFVDEAINLRRAGVAQALFCLNALPTEARKVLDWNLEVGVSDQALIEALEQAASAADQVIKVHLHVDTGMSRFGCRPAEALTLAERIIQSPNLELEGLMTHLACAENPLEDAFTQQQIDAFKQVVDALKAHKIHPRYIHAANSGAAIRHRLPFCNMVRIGLAIFGLHGSSSTRQSIDLRLAVSLTSRIAGINACCEGETVGYGRSYTVKRKEERIAIIPLGYFDGLHRQFSGKGYVLIHGQKAPMVGNICMDYMMVDVTDIAEAAIGDEVLIFGQDARGHYLPPEELATYVGSIAHEIISCLGPRVKRLFIYE